MRESSRVKIENVLLALSSEAEPVLACNKTPQHVRMQLDEVIFIYCRYSRSTKASCLRRKRTTVFHPHSRMHDQERPSSGAGIPIINGVLYVIVLFHLFVGTFRKPKVFGRILGEEVDDV